MSFIYKISNTINNKIYIGYTSRSLHRRLYEHIYESNESSNSILHQAIQKYGQDKFSISAIYEFDENQENWAELEQYYISQFNSLTPNGYNILTGGEKPPVRYGDSNTKTKISDKDIVQVYQMLQDNTIPYFNIAEQFNISISQLYLINSGKSRFNPLLNYPLRKFNTFEEKALCIIEDLKTDYLSLSDIANKYNIRPNEVASINQGKKYQYLHNEKIPIRNFVVPNDYQQKQQLSKDIIDYINSQSNKKITKKFLQAKFNIGRQPLDKVINGVYPYKISNQSYPLLLNT